MKRFFIYTLAVAALVLCSAFSSSPGAFAQTAATSSIQTAPVDSAKIIRAFTAKETEFRRALNEYAFKRDAVIQVIGMGGQITGEYHRVSFFTFDDSGNRYEKILFFPTPSLVGVVTPEDIEDLGGVNPFALEAEKLNQYNFSYVGKERIDELNLFIFDVTPKVIPSAKNIKERLFTGRIWVDDRDLQIVKSRGKGVPETKNNKFPYVETYREQIDGRYWFPTYSYADEELVYDDGQTMHIRMLVRYTDFVKGHADVRITEVDGDDVPDATEQQQKPQPPPANNPATPQAKTPITGSVLNSRAIELPKPKYPEAAKQAGIHGTVKVRVTVNEEGAVTEAVATEGPRELREAAVEAARKARFEPTRLHGQAIRIDGVLTYEF